MVDLADLGHYTNLTKINFSCYCRYNKTKQCGKFRKVCLSLRTEGHRDSYLALKRKKKNQTCLLGFVRSWSLAKICSRTDRMKGLSWGDNCQSLRGQRQCTAVWSWLGSSSSCGICADRGWLASSNPCRARKSDRVEVDEIFPVAAKSQRVTVMMWVWTRMCCRVWTLQQSVFSD